MEAAGINTLLEKVYTELSSSERLREEVRYTLKPKSQHRWEKEAYAYHGPDQATVNLLRSHQQSWLDQPWVFVSVPLSPLPDFAHPVLHTAGRCLQLSEPWNAWTLPVYRCFSIIFWRLQRQYNLPTSWIATALGPHFQCAPEILKKQIDRKVNAGSRYEWLRKELCEGVTMILGQNATNTFWENTMPKTGDGHKATLDHLKSVDMVGWARPYRTLENRILDFMHRQVETRNSVSYVQALALDHHELGSYAEYMATGDTARQPSTSLWGFGRARQPHCISVDPLLSSDISVHIAQTDA